MRINLIGGFLGSGKTTAITRACKHLAAANQVVGVITNDQGVRQVDTAAIKSSGVPVREVAGSCFCCNYDQFDAHIRSLEETQLPDVIFAESVGTCTDLVATIARPLARYRPEITVVVSVFSDAQFLASLLEGTSLFIEESVRYIYRKQMEEADVLVINKADLVTAAQRETITGMLAEEYPQKPFRFQDSTNDLDIRQWLDTVGGFTAGARVSLDLDYDMYGDGEARMAWLDRQISITADNGSAFRTTRKLMEGIFRRISEERLLIGHLKFFVDAGTWSWKVSFTSSSHDAHLLPDDHDAERVDLLINARVQTNPRQLTAIVDDALRQSEREGVRITHGEWSSFTPAYPRPTHRM